MAWKIYEAMELFFPYQRLAPSCGGQRRRRLQFSAENPSAYQAKVKTAVRSVCSDKAVVIRLLYISMNEAQQKAVTRLVEVSKLHEIFAR